MSFKDKMTEMLGFDTPSEEGGDHDAPEHLDPDGPVKSWSASDFSPEDYVDDEWIRRNTKEV